MSWKAEVIADGSGKWVANALRFSTYEEAKSYAIALGIGWTAVREARMVESDDPPNSRLVDGELVEIKKEVQS